LTKITLRFGLAGAEVFGLGWTLPLEVSTSLALATGLAVVLAVAAAGFFPTGATGCPGSKTVAELTLGRKDSSVKREPALDIAKSSPADSGVSGVVISSDGGGGGKATAVCEGCGGGGCNVSPSGTGGGFTVPDTVPVAETAGTACVAPSVWGGFRFPLIEEPPEAAFTAAGAAVGV
jgi:hypothetical protein